ncbi:MAG: DinB family protein, partial [Chloroflexota bacterium]
KKIEVRVADVRKDGPFKRGDRAALFAPDIQPLARAEMQALLRRAAYSRADLLTLVRGLPDDVLDWKREQDSMSVREILRHVGNAEEWYVSRIVSPKTLPPEWTGDDELPIFKFLAMQRRTVIRRLRQLTDGELSGVYYQRLGTEHLDEPWTARKALRRLLEHEREHLDHTRQVLAAWRAELLARMAAERGRLFWTVLGVDEKTVTTRPVAGEWTVKVLLAHIGAWDDLHRQRAALTAAGREADLPEIHLNDLNAALFAKHKQWTLNRAVALCVGARARYLAAFARIPDEALHRKPAVKGVWPIRLRTIWRHKHDAEHIVEWNKWRKKNKLKIGIGPKSLLLAALEAARDDLLATTALLPPDERDTRPLVGKWTLKDVMGHVADWEWQCVKGLRDVARGRDPNIDIASDSDTDRVNKAMAKARRGQSWDEVWDDLFAARRALLRVLDKMTQETLSRPFVSPWRAGDTAYRWVRGWMSHDLEHAAEIRAALGLAWPEKLLRFEE